MNKNLYIIYSKSIRDRNRYLQLKNFLGNHSFNIISLDYHGNSNFDKQIDLILNKVETILVLVSENAIRSNRFNLELSTVLNKEFSVNRRIIPIKLDNSDLPYSLNSNIYLNWEDNSDVNYKLILSAINKKIEIKNQDGTDRN